MVNIFNDDLQKHILLSVISLITFFIRSFIHMLRRRLPPVQTIQRLPTVQRTRKQVNKFQNNIDQIIEAGRRNGALLVTYIHKPTTDGPPEAQAVDVTTLDRANGQGTVEKASIIRTLIPRGLLLGRNNNLLCWCSDVTDYAGAGLIADPTVVHMKHFLVRNMTITRQASKPAGNAGITFDQMTTHIGQAAKFQPELYM